MTTHYSSLVEAGNGGGFVFAGITLFLMESKGGGESVVAKIVPGGLSKNYYRLPANEGIIRISLCLMGRSSKFNSDTTKNPPNPHPPPLTPANQATKNDRSLSAHRPWFTRGYLKLG